MKNNYQTETLENLAERAFNQVSDKMYKTRSVLYKEKEQELYDIYREIERLYKRTMSVGEAEFGRILAVFNLSVYLCDELDRLDGLLT